ncbi:MAG: AbiH family protein [Christensenellaceae bacterium]
MANLNIMGNGFDLYHGLPTSYYYFACYMLSTNENLYDDLAKMYGFSMGIMHRFTEELEREIDDFGYWRNFERSLGHLSSQWVENSLMDDLALENPDAVDLNIDLPNHSDAIKETLKSWVSKTIDIKKNFEIVREMLGEKKIEFSLEDTFVSFNYTHTLEEIYDIENVLHIHGEADSLMHEGDLIIGHGNNEILNNLQDKISELDGDDYDQPSRNRKLEYQFEKEVLENLRKPTEICRGQLCTFINKIDVPDYICVYGFSLGDVDISYIQLLKEKFSQCRWKFSYHSESDIVSIKSVAKLLGLEDTQYELFEFKNTDSSKIEARLVEENKIAIFPTTNTLKI